MAEAKRILYIKDITEEEAPVNLLVRVHKKYKETVLEDKNRKVVKYGVFDGTGYGFLTIFTSPNEEPAKVGDVLKIINATAKKTEYGIQITQTFRTRLIKGPTEDPRLEELTEKPPKTEKYKPSGNGKTTGNITTLKEALKNKDNFHNALVIIREIKTARVTKKGKILLEGYVDDMKGTVLRAIIWQDPEKNRDFVEAWDSAMNGEGDEKGKKKFKEVIREMASHFKKLEGRPLVARLKIADDERWGEVAVVYRLNEPDWVSLLKKEGGDAE